MQLSACSEVSSDRNPPVRHHVNVSCQFGGESLHASLHTSVPAAAQSRSAGDLEKVASHADLAEHATATTSVTRRLSDLDQRWFLFYAFVLCACRTAAQQPMNLALARKQTCSLSGELTTMQLLRSVYKHEGKWRGLRQGMAALTLACACSEVVYLYAFEYGREHFHLPAHEDADAAVSTGFAAMLWTRVTNALRPSLESEVARDAFSGYLADALCRCIHIPLSIVAYRQMTERQTVVANESSKRDSVRGALRTFRDRLSRFMFGPALSSSSPWQRGAGSHQFLQVFADDVIYNMRTMPVSGIHSHSLRCGHPLAPPTASHASSLWFSTTSPKSSVVDSMRPRNAAVFARGYASRHSHTLARDNSAIAGKTKSIVTTLKDLYAERGARSVFAGYGTTLLIGCQWSAMWWALYGQTKESMYAAATPLLVRVNRHDEDNASSRSKRFAMLPASLTSVEDNMALNSCASVFTSATTAVIFNPFLVLRTKLQVTPNSSLFSVAKSVVQTQGWRGFYAGLTLNVTACIVDGTLASTSYEYAKLWADKTHMQPAQRFELNAS